VIRGYAVSKEILEKLVDELSNLTVMEMSELKTLLEDKWGVQAQAAAVAMASVSGGAESEVEEATEFDVSLDEVPADKKISIIKEVRSITGLGLKEAKELVESAPKVIKEKAGKTEADELLKKLVDAGAKASVKGV
jgi:large subunit ribosomal protein L7/L12